MTTREPRPRCAGFSGVFLLVILLGVGVMLILMFGNLGGPSYVQNVVTAKKRGESLSIGIQARQLAILIADYRMNHDGRVPSTYQEMGADPSSFLDQWHRPLRFRFEGTNTRDAREVLVISDGPDEKPDTPDDIIERVPLQV